MNVYVYLSLLLLLIMDGLSLSQSAFDLKY